MILPGWPDIFSYECCVYVCINIYTFLFMSCDSFCKYRCTLNVCTCKCRCTLNVCKCRCTRNVCKCRCTLNVCKCRCTLNVCKYRCTLNVCKCSCTLSRVCFVVILVSFDFSFCMEKNKINILSTFYFSKTIFF